MKEGEGRESWESFLKLIQWDLLKRSIKAEKMYQAGKVGERSYHFRYCPSKPQRDAWKPPPHSPTEIIKETTRFVCRFEDLYRKSGLYFLHISDHLGTGLFDSPGGIMSHEVFPTFCYATKYFYLLEKVYETHVP